MAGAPICTIRACANGCTGCGRRHWCLWGDSDGIVSPDYGEKLRASLPNARFEKVAQAGHYPQIERPDAVADAIERFAGSEVQG